MGIKHNSLLYKSTFMGKKFSRPSPNFNNIEGFDTRSIDVSLGKNLWKKILKFWKHYFGPLWICMDIQK